MNKTRKPIQFTGRGNLVGLLAVALTAGTAGAAVSYDVTRMVDNLSCSPWTGSIGRVPAAWLVRGRLSVLGAMIELHVAQRSGAGRVPVLGPVGTSGARAASAPVQPPAPATDAESPQLVPLISILDEELQDLEDDLEESEYLITSSQGPPLSPQEKAELGDLLDKAESRIDLILDPNEEPSLNPPNAGAVDSLINPTTLAEYAEACHQLAVEAEAEIAEQSPDHEVIGTKIKTIKSLLPGYRNLAGST